MKTWLLAAILGVAGSSATGVEVGDSFQKMVEEKGAPSSKIEVGGATVVRYPDATIKLRDGKVSDITYAAAANREPEAPKSSKIAAGQWTTDYVAAMAQAFAQKKKAFLFFTGSDWCPWCKRLDREVLATEDFISYARENLILVKLDFPREIPQSSQLKTVNANLAKHYGVGGYPTVIILDGEGRLLRRLSYMEGGPKPYLKELKKL